MVLKKLQVATTLLCMLSYAEAGTVSIGTASARGEMRVDHNSVKGNATLFDGSVVETGQATANLHLNKGAQITLSTGARSTLYSNRIILEQGSGEFDASRSFQLEANGIHVTPNQPHSRAVVELKPDKTVEVASLDGSFGITNSRGILLANILPGSPLTFAMQAGAGAEAESFSGTGLVSFENGTYYLTTDTHAKYVLTCKDPHRFVGNKVQVSGTLQGAGQGSTMLCLKSIDINSAGGMSSRTKWIIAGVLVGAGLGAGLGLAAANSGSPAASR